MNETASPSARQFIPQPVIVAGGLAVAAIVGLLAWQALKPGASGNALGKLEGDMHALLFTNDGRVLYGQHGGIQVSSDAGKTWSAPSGQGDAMGLGASGDALYMAGHDVFQKSNDGGKTWTSPGFANLPGTDIHGFAVAPSSGWLYANLAGSGLYRSTDGGKAWQAVNAATGGAMALAIGSGTPPAMFAATMQGMIRSTDGGASWQPLPNASSLVGMALSVAPKSGAVYASSTKGVVRSTDNGETWTELAGPGEAVALVAPDPSDEQKLMAVSGTGQVYSSTDGGGTWKGR